MEKELERHLTNLIRENTTKDVLDILRTSSEPETSALLNLLYVKTVKNLCDSLSLMTSMLGVSQSELRDFIDVQVKSTIEELWNR